MRNTAIDFLYETVEKYPDKMCVSDNHQKLTFRQLFENAFALAEILRQGGEINQPVLVYFPKSVSAIVSFAGVLMSGNFYAPIDIGSPQKRTKAIVENLGAYRIVSSRLYEEALKRLGLDQKRTCFIEDIHPCKHGLSAQEIVEVCRRTTDKIIDTDPCYVMHTSGSTGVPKGVVIAHQGVMDYIEWAISFLAPDHNDIIGNQAPLYFDNSTLDIYLSWASGATLNLIPENLFAFPVKLIEYLEEKCITFVFFVPSVLVNISKINVLSPSRLPSLKKIIFAGEVMPTKHLAHWQDNLPDRLYVNLYGPTEITVDCTYFVVDRRYESHESLPIGFPCHNSGVLILNSQNELAAPGEQGELCVRGSSLALGYWNDDEKTNQAFVQNPLQKSYSDRIYRTGDIVYQNERDEIIYVGRKDSQIKHMGHRIELGEIETAALTMPEIDTCCVLYNENKKEITIFYEGSEAILEGNFRKLMTDILPGYMIPRKVHYLEALPMNPNGKIDRKALMNEFT
jgi:amino acid adenylation domain-containing protein